MVAEAFPQNQTSAVLFSAGLDSAVLLAQTARAGGAQPIYVRSGLAWETQELERAERLLRAFPGEERVLPLVTLTADMRDVFPAHHWAIRGNPPAFDTPDEDVYIEGRNIVLLAKASVFMARAKLTRIVLGPLAGNPFPDATRHFFTAMGAALSAGLASPIRIDAPLADLHKEDVIRLGTELGVPFGLTLSCMQPAGGLHCGRCSKCRERRDGFSAAGMADPAPYASAPLR